MFNMLALLQDTAGVTGDVGAGLAIIGAAGVVIGAGIGIGRIGGQMADAMARQPAATDPEVARQFEQLDERLDEISRAIVATTSTQDTAVDREVVERLESRFDVLVERIGQMGKSSQTQIGQAHQSHSELAERMEALTQRVEQLANEEAVTALAERLDMLTHTLTSVHRV